MKKVLVTGGAGFIGSHLCDSLLSQEHKVICVDNLITGRRENIKHLEDNPHFSFLNFDISVPLPLHPLLENIDYIFHLASPASPFQYQKYPIETYKANGFGTHHLLEFCLKKKASFLFASSSEIYGEPAEHPQKETYRGNVNPVGPRACYDESKRFGEMVTMEFFRKFKANVRIVRTFNTYGPRMNPEDGRVIPNFILQALKGEAITVYGDGAQTRSFCYIADMVEGIQKAIFDSKTTGEIINLGNPEECTILNLAKIIKELTQSSSEITFVPLPPDDPSRRKPDIQKAKKLLDWFPKVSLKEGLQKTIEYFKPQ